MTAMKTTCNQEALGPAEVEKPWVVGFLSANGAWWPLVFFEKGISQCSSYWIVRYQKKVRSLENPMKDLC